MEISFKLEGNMELCRTCLKVNTNYFNIFKYSQNNKFISEILIECTSLKIQKDDGFPVNICSNCLEKLNLMLDFKKMVKLSDLKLHHFYEGKVVETKRGVEYNDLNDMCVKEEYSILKSEHSDLVDNSLYKYVTDTGTLREDTIHIDNNWNNSTNISNEELTLQNHSYIGNNDSGVIEDYGNNEDIEFTESIEGATEEKQIHLKTNNHKTYLEHNTENITTFHDELSSDSTQDSNQSSSDAEYSSSKNATKERRNYKKPSNWIKKHTEILDNPDGRNISISLIKKATVKDKNAFKWNEKHFDILSNPDCRRIVNSHMSKKEKDRSTVFCKECGKTVNFRYYVQVHAQTHMGNIPFKCEKCNKSFAQRHLLNQHVRAVHEKITKLSCDVCGKGFTSLSIMLHHKTKHSNERPHKCDTCGKSFKLSGTLKKHCQIHTNERQYMCELCGRAFVEKIHLTEHFLTHGTEKKFKCTTCEKSFATKRSLECHSKRHSGNKPFVCSYCNKAFTYGSVLKRHILIHTGVKPFTCAICERKFRQHSSLRYHMRIHTGETPFECEVCANEFRYKHHLKNHMKRIHKKDMISQESKT